eukprot:TRINITY_DN17223_c0_g1_i1.p2 TRINITY_DN17223_c0_g1~~TRINITY_DN17223_c0_g1_i1.p2  ORF type:complete len:188 (+),score=-15.88 TRINITY_DN17223_c0_g1_i1:347-910(+)
MQGQIVKVSISTQNNKKQFYSIVQVNWITQEQTLKTKFSKHAIDIKLIYIYLNMKQIYISLLALSFLAKILQEFVWDPPQTNFLSTSLQNLKSSKLIIGSVINNQQNFLLIFYLLSFFLFFYFFLRLTQNSKTCTFKLGNINREQKQRNMFKIIISSYFFLTKIPIYKRFLEKTVESVFKFTSQVIF